VGSAGRAEPQIYWNRDAWKTLTEGFLATNKNEKTKRAAPYLEGGSAFDQLNGKTQKAVFVHGVFNLICRMNTSIID
jgi:hypothetical protein